MVVGTEGCSDKVQGWWGSLGQPFLPRILAIMRETKHSES